MDDFLSMMGYRYYLIKEIIDILKGFNYINIDIIENVCNQKGTSLSELTQAEKDQIFNLFQ